jgi:hypothetical protein
MSEFVSSCPKCRQKILCDTQYVGQRVACPLCLQEIMMPSPPPPTNAPAASQPPPPPPPAKRGVPVSVVVGILVLLVVVVAAGAWLLHSRSATPAGNPASTTTPGTVAPMGVRVGPIVIANAGFETPVVSSFLYNPSGAGWTFSTNGPASGSGVTTINKNGDSFTAKNLPPPEGNQMAFLQSTGSISQVLSGFVPGGRYKLTFAAAQRANKRGGQAGETFTVFINSTAIGSFLPDQSTTTYYEYSVDFVAPAASNILTFQGTDLNGGDNTVLIDDVRITPP